MSITVPPETVRSITVLGGGSAGFIAALTLKRRRPHLRVRVLRSAKLGIIGVGEGTTPYFPQHIHGYLGLKPDRFYAAARPVWKLGIRYENWGPRDSFNYTFTPHTDFRHANLPKNNGYYCGEDFSHACLESSLMDACRVFQRQANGAPVVSSNFGYHLENRLLVEYLEARCRDFGVEIAEATVTGVRRREDGGISSLELDSGGVESADFFVDASGFYSELLGREMQEPFKDYRDSLFCDRAVVGGWERPAGDVIKPFTTAEGMDAGWCWRIDHEHLINRGYVFSSDHIADGAAEEEFRRRNPLAGETRVVKFRTGRYARSWVHNVVAVGNASGFVEPLEATALMVICLQSRALADGLGETDDAPTPSLARMFNDYMAGIWDEIRDFLSIHYKYNSRQTGDFWIRCRNETALHGAAGLVEFYRENGPSTLAKPVLLHPNSPFGMEGYLTLLTGMKVPHARPERTAAAEWMKWKNHTTRNKNNAARAMTVAEALAMIRHPNWKWL